MVSSLGSAVAEEEPALVGGTFADPVFVLCNGRSGSTLLRFLLDAHPELACPPETNIASLCAQLATVWSLIEGAPLSANRGDEPPAIPDAAIAGVRETMDRMTGSYLARRGKKRYCDKSLGTARYAELLLRVYPQARFICLYRHPMDVIASGMEACPWGLTGYGFDPYIAATPGNAVLALARFWADNVTGTIAAEERFPGHCIRVRYEDLVTDPERTAAGIFDFLGAAPAPGVATSCLSRERERYGPGDHKIWHTSRISADSVGRGWSVPATMISPPVLAAINELAEKLGYRPVDGGWGTSAPPADLRLPTASDGDEAPAAAAGLAPTADAAGPASSERFAERLRAGLAQAGPDVVGRWGKFATETAVAVWVPEEPGLTAEHWLIDLADKSVTLTTAAAQETSAWDVIGSGATWQQVMAGSLNLSVALRACRLRYCDDDEVSDPVAASARISILSELLGITTW
jgi:hypothetical protein